MSYIFKLSTFIIVLSVFNACQKTTEKKKEHAVIEVIKYHLIPIKSSLLKLAVMIDQ